MRKPINQAPNAARESMSPAAWCIHRILTSPSYRKRGCADNAQAHLLKACATRLSDKDRQRLVALGHKAYAPEPQPEPREFVAPEDIAA